MRISPSPPCKAKATIEHVFGRNFPDQANELGARIRQFSEFDGEACLQTRED